MIKHKIVFTKTKLLVCFRISLHFEYFHNQPYLFTVYINTLIINIVTPACFVIKNNLHLFRPTSPPKSRQKTPTRGYLGRMCPRISCHMSSPWGKCRLLQVRVAFMNSLHVIRVSVSLLLRVTSIALSIPLFMCCYLPLRISCVCVRAQSDN